VACGAKAGSFLEGQGDSPLMQRERLRISMVRQSFNNAPPGQGGHAPTTPQRRALSAAESAHVNGLATKVQVSVRRLLSAGWFDFAKDEMRAGRNPGRKEWQRILCQGLLAGGISRAELCVAFEQRLDMTPGSAKVRASSAVSIFFAGRLLIEQAGRMTLNRN